MQNAEKRRLFDAVIWTFSAMFLVLFLVHESHRGAAATDLSALTQAPATVTPAPDCDRRQSSKPVAVPAVYTNSCSECHLAYSPRFLPAASWTLLMAGLNDHFGRDASMAASDAAAILSYLSQNARAAKTTDAAPPVLRITDARWWKRQHAKIKADRWNHPRIASRGSCEACHVNAAAGRFGKVRLPKAGEP